MISTDLQFLENESASYLELGNFSDHVPDLFLNQHEISDRLVYNKLMFEAKNFLLLLRGFPAGGKRKIPPLWKTDHEPKKGTYFF